MYVTDSVMLPISYVIENPTSVNYKQTTANFRRLYIIRYRPFESNLSAANPNLTNLNLARYSLYNFANIHRMNIMISVPL